MRCPTCKREAGAGELRFRPFCSERCKLIDLGRWLDGSYAIPASDDEQEESDGVSTGDDDDEGTLQ